MVSSHTTDVYKFHSDNFSAYHDTPTVCAFSHRSKGLDAGTRLAVCTNEGKVQIINTAARGPGEPGSFIFLEEMRAQILLEFIKKYRELVFNLIRGPSSTSSGTMMIVASYVMSAACRQVPLTLSTGHRLGRPFVPSLRRRDGSRDRTPFRCSSQRCQASTLVSGQS